MLLRRGMVPEPGPELSPEANPEEGEFGLDQLKEFLGLFVRAPRRHPRLAFVAAMLTLAIGVFIAAFWPRSYACNVRILAQHNLVLPALDNPNRAVPRDADNPTKNAADAILQHDNLVTMIKELDLVERWQANRSAVMRLKDKITSFGATRSDADQQRDMIDLLEKRLSVANDESSITIAIEWPDRQVGFEIVSFLLKNFLEARYDSNVNVISEAIRILEARAQPQAAEVDAALEELTKVENERRAAARAAVAPTVRRGWPIRRVPSAAASSDPSGAGSGPADTDGDVARQLEEVRSRIRLLTQERDRELMQAHQQLADARATLGPLHPTVVALNEKIAQLDVPPPELRALEDRERQLVAALASSAPAPSPRPTGSADVPAPAAPPASPAQVADTRPLGTPGVVPAGSPADLRDDPQVALAFSKLQAASTKYSELLSRIESANIELEVTRAAFKYQYTVVRPPELARKPSKPNAPLVLIMTLLASVFLAFLVPGLRDLLKGQFVEAWQVERTLKLPLLGEVAPPPP